MQSPRSPLPASDSDVSPASMVPSKQSQEEYFPPSDASGSQNSVPLTFSVSDASSRRQSKLSFATALPKPDGAPLNKTSSGSSVTKRRPLGVQKRSSDGPKARPPSPPPHTRFERHVGFDNVPIGESSKKVPSSVVLTVKHNGYQPRRRSRTFMVGIDENPYSEYAVQWLLDELVDDGDEIICVRVIEKDMRLTEKSYYTDAQQVMDSIMAKNGSNRAVAFILEYAVGKLHSTFQSLIQLYQPAMLIVGTRGRSLGGLQGLVNNRNSFSKYCLQYSPVPVVVVRPSEKRNKKKAKRTNDNSRQTYVSMLAATHGKHEADSESSSTYELEVQISPDEEAHQVAQVLGLPAKFDPTIKPHHEPVPLRSKSPDAAPGPRTSIARRVVSDPMPSSAPPSAPNSEDEEDDEEDEFEVMTGAEALDQQQKLDQLHKMEASEAAALRHGIKAEEDDEEDEAQGRNSESTS
ncbi:hypothetical protein TGAM01_v207449 [Trichoderma gamsii]|uniref:UspA domain-containing protein n=1 Tax=Trichoderma gamsii TaxID=398673 RepID=A0A2P4ZHP2_9HYPO|nr:hypothetical protein TGAM01_v207449 [Trichoderma gamsii]PON23802.1 hypothetical protein TGAM01_v207449 [Trichoderma gamsii]